jgi:hypothetical protein
MRASLLTAAAVALTLPAAARAQAERPRRAFDPAVSLTASISLFGARLTDSFGSYGYRNSIGVGLWGELPMTRRTGLLALVNVAPLSAQRAELSGSNTALFKDVVSYTADLGVGARLKPAVPVFFLLGGGVHGATHYAHPQAGGSVVEPQGTVGVGYDAGRSGRWNVRAAVLGHVVKPADPGEEQITAKSTSFDWSFHIGGRYALGGSSPAPGTPSAFPSSHDTPAPAPTRRAP